MEHQEIVLEERDQIVINSAIEYSQKALEYDQSNKPVEAIELYQRAIYLLENEKRSVSSPKFRAYKLYIDAYNSRVKALQFQLENDTSCPESSRVTQFNEDPRLLYTFQTENKPMTKMIEDLSPNETILQVLKSFLVVFTEGGNLTKNLHVPYSLWSYSFEEDDEIFFKESGIFYEKISDAFSEHFKEEKVKNKEVNLKDFKASISNVYKSYGRSLMEMVNSYPVIVGKPLKLRKTTKINEYTNILKRNLAKLTTNEDNQVKKIKYVQMMQDIIKDFLSLIVYLEDEYKENNNDEVKKFREFIYIFCEEVFIKLLLFETKLKLNIYFSKIKEKI